MVGKKAAWMVSKWAVQMVVWKDKMMVATLVVETVGTKVVD